MDNPYLEVVSLVERLHRQIHGGGEAGVGRLWVRDINNVQAMMLFNIGDVEMTVGELTLRVVILARTSPITSRRW